MFRFADPYYFFLLIPAGIAAWFAYRKRITSGILFAPTFRLPAAGRTWRTYAAHVLPVLFLAGLVLAVAALARPQTVFSRTHRTADAIAMEMVVDVSGSMGALDLSTRTPAGIKYRTRLDVVKQTFAEFVEKRPDDLIGLVTFGGYATTRSPLTTDHSALLHVLQGVEIPKPAHGKNGQIINQEELLTAIGDALATACGRLEHAEPKSKIIVLLSDGESNTGIIRPEQAMKAAKELGVKVYTIGVGSTGRAPFMGRDIFGRKSIQYAHVTLDEALLKNIADTTGGRYFNVRDPGGLEKAMKDIDNLEKTKIEREEYNQYNELFHWLLGPALGLIVLGTGLNMMIAKRII